MTDIAIWGAHAERFVARHRSARVAGVYARSLHLEADGDFLCLGDASIGRGPLNALFGAADWTRSARDLPAQGTRARIDQGAIRIGSVVFTMAAAQRWRPPPWPRIASGEGLVAALGGLVRLAGDRAPADGLARTVLGLADGAASAFERVARPRVERLRLWVTARPSATTMPPPVDLLGLGPGLTPSGDDLLCGMLVALYAIGRTDMAQELYAEIAKAAPIATSPLSLAFLQAAAEGLGAEPLHAAIGALLVGPTSDIGHHLEALGRTGHTSGWDALAGAVLALRAFGPSKGHRAGVARARISL